MSGVKKQAGLRRASSYAKEINEQANPSSASDFVKHSKAAIEFQIMTLQSEIKLLEELSNMSDDAKLIMLFDLMDRNNDGYLSALELADGLMKIRANVDFEESLALAVQRVETFDTNADGLVDRNEFETLLNSLLPLIGCSFHNLSEILVIQVLFAEGLTPIETSVADVISDDLTQVIKTDEELRLAMKDRRMKALFNVFDEDDQGAVDFKDVVVGMFKLMEDIDEASHAAVTALLLFDEEEKRELQYRDFCRLILNVVASSGEFTFDDVADTLTRNAIDLSSGVTRDYVVDRFNMDRSCKVLLHIADDEALSDLSAVELAKIERLFAMFDNDNDEMISFRDLALGLAKFHITTGMDKTIEETEQVMKAFAKTSEGMLTKQEFAVFIVNFASSTAQDLVDFIDFMIVTMALKENTVAFQEYLDSIKADSPLDHRYG
jgi:Ca2+-binding EF-hand superfamily protein